ncbi:hypothetical protein, partial [Achromobacter marplatensis]|uniref:hypothetical protein n=1 Tax=Achromobacter marplatensis TaxID=470868 RepID=UPI000277E3EA
SQYIEARRLMLQISHSMNEYLSNLGPELVECDVPDAFFSAHILVTDKQIELAYSEDPKSHRQEISEELMALAANCMNTLSIYAEQIYTVMNERGDDLRYLNARMYLTATSKMITIVSHELDGDTWKTALALFHKWTKELGLEGKRLEAWSRKPVEITHSPQWLETHACNFSTWDKRARELGQGYRAD